MNFIKYIKAVLGLSFFLTMGSMLQAQPYHHKEKNHLNKTSESDSLIKVDVLKWAPGPLIKIPEKRSVTFSSSLKGTVLESTPTANLTNTLFGRLNGLNVLQNSGEPGYDNATWYVQGRATYDDADPIVYVDGFEATPRYVWYLSPSEIENISVLKDAASLAPFGMKGANGIVWITTKRGHSEGPKIKVQAIYGLQTPEKLNKPLNSYDYAYLYNIAASNDNSRTWTPKYTDADLSAYKNGTDPNGHPNVDWFSECVNNTSPFTSANMSFNGGNNNIKYLLMGDYLMQEGLWKVPFSSATSNSRIQRYNLRENLDLKFFNIFEGKVDLGGRIEDRRYPNYDGPTLWNHLGSYPSNIYPVKDSTTGGWSGSSTYPDNPVGSLYGLGWTSTHDRVLQANLSLKEHLDFLTKGLYLEQAASFNNWTRSTASWTKTYARYYYGVLATTDVNSDLVASGTSATTNYEWDQGTLTAGYDRQFGEHIVNATVTYLRSNYISDELQTYYHNENYGGRFHYSFKNRYEAEASFGYSGSDYYADGHHWAFYPAFALGWIASEESFLNNNKTIDYLKIRASVGKVGNEQTGNGRYLYQQYYASSGTYYTGNGSSLTSHTGIIPSGTATPDITAEHSWKYDIGIDMDFWKHLSASIDFFEDKRSGIITANNNIQSTYGVSTPYENIGRVTNKGVEVTANYQNKIGEFNYAVQGQFSYYRNKINYESEVAPVNKFSAITGREIGTPRGLIADGLYQTSDFDASGNLNSSLPTPAFGSVQPGDIKYKDLDGDGDVDANDITKIGYPELGEIAYSFSLNLNYKGFDASVLLQGVAHRSVSLYSNASLATVAFVSNANAFPIAKGAWSYYPNEGIDTRSSATYPRLTTQSNTNNYRASSFWEKSGDFLRLRSVEIGYSFSANMLRHIRIQKLRIYLNAVNPYTWSGLLKKYKLDPEHMSGYTVIKSFNGGLSVDF